MFLKIEKGVHYLTEKKIFFSNQYISVRKKENRVLNDNDVLQLPHTTRLNPNHREWKMRQKSANRFIKFLKDKKHINILEIGCGNGWFSNLMATQTPENNIYGLDINIDELEQASRIFNKINIQFIYANIFELNKNSFECQFDMIILNASIQYFNDINILLSKLKDFSKSDCEIHIMDSFFYKEVEINAAKKRTYDYYNQLGFPEMSAYYHHHLYSDIKSFKVLYQPNNSIINKVFRKKDSPFLWIYKKCSK